MSLWVKICGITSLQDAQAAVAAGADAIGLNFWPGSPRHITLGAAHAIVAAVRGQVEIVTVTVDMPLVALQALDADLRPDRLQLHGHEPDAWLEALGPRAYRAVGLGDPADCARACASPGPWVLVDARDEQAKGGTGRSISTDLAARVCRARPTIVAGGLSPENVSSRVALLRPAGVDAASRLELAPGRKDPKLMQAFVHAARSAVPTEEDAHV